VWEISESHMSVPESWHPVSTSFCVEHTALLLFCGQDVHASRHGRRSTRTHIQTREHVPICTHTHIHTYAHTQRHMHLPGCAQLDRCSIHKFAKASARRFGGLLTRMTYVQVDTHRRDGGQREEHPPAVGGVPHLARSTHSFVFYSAHTLYESFTRCTNYSHVV
jgi:hypothetical protein